MKNIFLGMAFFMSINLFAQVGIGTSTPNSNAILDLTATNKALLLPRVANTAAVSSPTNGMMIYDISSNCFKAFENNAWTDCLSSGSGSSSATSVVANCGTGFVGNFINGIPLTAGASYQVTITNNTLSTANLTFANSDLTLGGAVGTIVRGTPSPTSANIAPGASTTITYPLTGIPGSGTLTATWTKVSLNCSASRVVDPLNSKLNSNYCTNAAFAGNYISGIAMTGSNTFTVTLTNTSGVAITGMPAPAIGNLALSYSATASPVFSVSAVSPSTTFNLGIGASQVITYTLAGRATAEGDLTATWNYSGLTCTKIRNVALGTAVFTNATNNTYVFSANDPSVPIDFQGIMAIGTTVNIPYTSGIGTYTAYSSPFTSIPAQFCEDAATDWTFGYTYSAGTFSTTGSIVATLITKKNGVITPWPAKKVPLIDLINYNCVFLPLVCNNNTYPNTVGIDEGGDAIRGAIALGGNTSGSAYDATTVNSWVSITKAEYDKIVLILGRTTAGNTDAFMLTNPGNPQNFGGPVSITSNSPNHTKINASSYIMAFQLKTSSMGTPSTLAGMQLKTSLSQISSFVNYGGTTPNAAQTLSAATNYYFAIKRPTGVTSAGGTSFFAFYQSASNQFMMTPSNGGTCYVEGSANVNNFNTANSFGQTIWAQILATPIKQW